MTAPQKRNPAGGPGFEDAQTNGLGLHANDTAHHAARLLVAVSTPVADSPLTPARMLQHIADVLDVVIGHLSLGAPVSLAGRAMIGHCAERLRAVAEVLK